MLRIACKGTDALAYLSNESTIKEEKNVPYTLELITVDCVLCQRSIFESKWVQHIYAGLGPIHNMSVLKYLVDETNTENQLWWKIVLYHWHTWSNHNRLCFELKVNLWVKMSPASIGRQKWLK
jgi:hypothetical protein